MAGIATAAQFIAPIISGVSAVSGLANSVSNARDTRREQNLDRQQQQANQTESYRRAQEDAAARRQEIAFSAQDAEAVRRKALKRAVAKQRAEYGSSGISANNGSAEAVLLGMFEESDAERQRREELDALRLSNIDQDLNQQLRGNILERTQLAERQRLSRLSSGIDQYGRIIRSGANAVNTVGDGLEQ